MSSSFIDCKKKKKKKNLDENGLEKNSRTWKPLPYVDKITFTAVKED